MKQLTYYPTITAAFAVVLVLSNITSAKLAQIGSFAFDAGLILFPLAYIFGDVLTEVYGYAKSRRVIWTGFFLSALAAVTFWIVGLLPASPDWPFQESYMHVLGIVPRIFFASVIAYLVGEFTNSYILAKMKVKQQGKQFWKRAIGSTLVGQLLDTTIFLLVAFAGVFPWPIIWVIWYTNYIVKVLVEIVLLPVTSRLVAFLKEKEGADHYDTDTNFNPLSK